MFKRKSVYALLLALPLVAAIALYSAASWRPRALGVHPFATIAKTKTSAPVPIAAIAVTPDLMMAPDGKRLLSFSRDGSDSIPRGLAMWDVGREAMLWQKQQQDVLDWEPLGFSRDGVKLVMAHNPGPSCCVSYGGPGLAFFDAQTGTKTRDLSMKQFAYTFGSAAFAPDGKRLVTATNNGVQGWDVASGRVTKFLDARALVGETQSGYQLNIEFSREAQRAAVIWGNWKTSRKGSRMQLAVHDLGLNGGLKWKVPTGAPAQMEFSPDGRLLLLSARHSANFEIVEVATGQSLWKKAIVETFVGDGLAVWLPDSSAIVVANVDQFELLDARTGRLLRRLSRIRRRPETFVIAPDGTRIYGIDAQGHIQSQRLQ